MTSTMDNAAKHTYGYWFEDGLAEIAGGVVFLLVAAVLAAEGFSLLPPWMTALAFPVVVIAGAWLGGRLVQAAKLRLTYPRTGYVAYARSSPRRRLLTAFVGALIALLLVRLAAARPSFLDWLPALQGMILGTFCLLFTYRGGPARFYAVAVWAPLVGSLGTLLNWGATLGSAAVYGLTGLMLLVTGALALRLHLSATHTPPETE